MRRPLYSSSSNHAVTNLERNESNSSTDYEKHLQRNDSHKENLDHDTESSGEFPDFENDSDLNTAEEPENWWAFTQTQNLDKEYLESLMSNKKEVKRQENIYEFIHTEANHARTLRIMQKIFIGRMRAELDYSKEKCSEFFPALQELSDISREFLARLKKRKSDEMPIVEHFADVLYEFWNSDWGERKAKAYGRFCARQHDSLRLYKEELKNNKKFSSLMRKYKAHRLTKRLDIPDCIQLATQRLTKYPLLLENILKNTENSAEKAKTTEALEIIQKIAQSVNGEMKDYERTKQLEDIITNIERTSSTRLNEKRFNRKHLNQYGRQLINTFEVQYKVKEKFTDVMMLILEDILVLLNSKSGTYSFVQSAQVLLLKNLHIRENATDHACMYIVSTANMTDNAMWELRASSHEKLSEIIQQIELAIEIAPKEGVESRRRTENKIRETSQKANSILSEMNHFNQRIANLQSEKVRLKRTLFELYHPVPDDLFQDDPNPDISLSECASRIRDSVADLAAKPDIDNETFNIATSLSSLVEQLQNIVQAQNDKMVTMERDLDEQKQMAGFRGSRGVLEAEQKRFASKHQEALREAQESKQRYEEGILMNKEERLKLESREKEIDRQKEALERQRLEVQDSWNNYQKECEALRKAREAQSGHVESSSSRDLIL